MLSKSRCVARLSRRGFRRGETAGGPLRARMRLRSLSNAGSDCRRLGRGPPVRCRCCTWLPLVDRQRAGGLEGGTVASEARLIRTTDLGRGGREDAARRGGCVQNRTAAKLRGGGAAGSDGSTRSARGGTGRGDGSGRRRGELATIERKPTVPSEWQAPTQRGHDHWTNANVFAVRDAVHFVGSRRVSRAVSITGVQTS